MQWSKHNVTGKIHGSDEHYVINVLSGNADIIDRKTAESWSEKKWVHQEEMIEKGYLVDPAEELKIFNNRYMDFIESRESDEVQLFFVPHYGCNFSCTYCFQEEYDFSKSPLSLEVMDAFFTEIDKKFSDRRKYLTLFGGEPLLPGAENRSRLERFIKLANDRELDLAVVTNGYLLKDYLPVLEKARLREIQVTIDGPAQIHNKRRMLKGGQESFNQIAEGVQAALDLGIVVNLRAVLDRENLEFLPDLAQYAIDQGWTQKKNFKTQLGRNYELHTCQVDQKRLYTRAEMYAELRELCERNPHVLEFHKPAFSISRFLFENGETPYPLFDSCTGTKTEWAYDYQGRIFACTATVGKAGEELGTFWPEQKMDIEAIEEWEDRDVTAMEQCKDCRVALLCGGGCAAVAKNKNGSVLTPDCRPVESLLENGMSLYFKNDLKEE